MKQLIVLLFLAASAHAQILSSNARRINGVALDNDTCKKSALANGYGIVYNSTAEKYQCVAGAAGASGGAPSIYPVTGAGTANAWTGCPTGSPAIADKMTLSFRPLVTNTGAVTLAYCSGVAKSVVDQEGNALVGGEAVGAGTLDGSALLLQFSEAANLWTLMTPRALPGCRVTAPGALECDTSISVPGDGPLVIPMRESPPGNADAGTLRLYSLTSDKKPYVKDPDGAVTELGGASSQFVHLPTHTCNAAAPILAPYVVSRGDRALCSGPGYNTAATLYPPNYLLSAGEPLILKLPVPPGMTKISLHFDYFPADATAGTHTITAAVGCTAAGSTWPFTAQTYGDPVVATSGSTHVQNVLESLTVANIDISSCTDYSSALIQINKGGTAEVSIHLVETSGLFEK